jgi:serine/threonine protein kinase/Flp pilus assembly protein TadD
MEGRTISHYSILRKLGAGGMGEVYLAQDTTLSRKVAIKFLSQNSVGGEQARKRLVREAKAAAALDHPHICAVHEVGEEGGYSFIVMQYVEGETLASRIQRQPIEVREALDIAAQIADALAEAHSRRIIHRDVKPQNIMLTASGQVKVLDFGLARVVREGALIESTAETESLLTVPGLVMGTVPYMSPEQVRGEELDARSDIFSFGAVLYEMLSGRNPFQGASVGATMSSILTKDPAPLARYASDVPDELQRVVRKALSKDKEGRYQTIKDLLIDLRELKQELEFEAKLERSSEPEVRARSTTPERAESGGRAHAKTAPQETVRTGESFTTSTTSSSRIVIGEIRRHKLAVTLTLAALLIAAVAAYFYFQRRPVLTDKDTILIADFVNTTGDPDFDGALKQALAVQLEQSPFLNIFSEERVRQTLRYMGRSPDGVVTKDVAREICQRQGLKAMLVGSISSLGSHYVVGLDAVNAQTADVIARQQVEADSKEQVLSVLGKATTTFREKLGESLSTIRKFDAPIEQVTTSSLEALKAFSLVREQRFRGGNFLEAIATLKRAIELDPKFARAYAETAVVYANLGQLELAAEYAERSYQLRERTNEREKMLITANYYVIVTGELEKTVETLKLWAQTYPRDAVPHQLLSVQYISSGQSNQPIEEARESIRLDPDYAPAYLALARGLIALDRFDEAKETLNQALMRKLDSPFYHRQLYLIAFVLGDSTSMKQHLDWLSGRPDEYQALNFQAQTAAFAGRLHESRLFSRRAVALAKQGSLLEEAATSAIQAALLQAVVGLSVPAKEDLAEALTLSRGSFTEGLRNTGSTGRLSVGPMTLALSGEVGQAQSFAEEMARRNPKNTLTQAVWLPVNRAAIEFQRSHPDNAIELLKSASQYERGAGFSPIYLRGQAYLRLKRGAEAAAEFQKILDHRGWDPTSYLYPLAHLGLARAAALTGDVAGSRKAYQDFFALWKDAEADLPILIEAKKEYADLK